MPIGAEEAEDHPMRVLTASVTTFALAALVAGVGATAFACDFKTQATAQATTPTPVEEEVVEASTIDPVLLAYLKRTAAESDDVAETTQAE
jgi:hypothetical protein